jgi:hypothetical protein
MIPVILLVFAFVLACLATFKIGAPRELGWASLACYFLSVLLGGAPFAHLFK